MEQRDKKKTKPKSIAKSSEIPNQNKEIIVAKNIDGDNNKLKTNTITSDSGDPSLTPIINNSNNNNNIILKISQPQQNENKYSKRKVINNWDKYEEKSQNNSNNINPDNEQLVAADFQKLLDAPQSIGSHFFFNSEKQWIDEDTTISSTPLTTTRTTINNSNNKSNKIQIQQSSQKYFNLNLSLLIEGITSIPFYERQNYPIDLFNNDEIEDMRRRSNEIKFGRKIEINNIINSVPSTTIAPSPNKLKTNEVIVKNVNDQKCDKVIIKEINKIKTSNDNIDQVKYVDDDEDENELDTLFDSNLNTDKLPIALNKTDSVKIINKNVNESVQVTTNIGTSIITAAEKTQPTIVKPVIHNTKEDIQQWLDDILDD